MRGGGILTQRISDELNAFKTRAESTKTVLKLVAKECHGLIAAHPTLRGVMTWVERRCSKRRDLSG